MNRIKQKLMNAYERTYAFLNRKLNAGRDDGDVTEVLAGTPQEPQPEASDEVTTIQQEAVKKEEIETREETVPVEDTLEPSSAEKTDEAIYHEPYANSVLFNPDGTPKGKPYKRQERVRKICVGEFADAYLMFCSLGDHGTGFVHGKGGYSECVINDSANGLHFEMLVKPQRYPLHTIATLTVKCDEGISFPIDTVYFIKEQKK